MQHPLDRIHPDSPDYEGEYISEEGCKNCGEEDIGEENLCQEETLCQSCLEKKAHKDAIEESKETVRMVIYDSEFGFVCTSLDDLYDYESDCEVEAIYINSKKVEFPF